MAENIAKTQAFKLKGRLYTLTVIQVLSASLDLFKKLCTDTIALAPKFFDRTPIVFDLSAVSSLELDLSALCEIVRQCGMLPLAIQGGNPLQNTIAQAIGLAILSSSGSQDRPLTEPKEQSKEIKAKLVRQPVRSGQQIVAKGRDLVVTSTVSPGAEILADGNIHVYGPLRGRALAGISGDRQARIYCQSLEAELVSIAGFYRLSDVIGAVTGPCQIYLDNEHIMIEPL